MLDTAYWTPDCKTQTTSAVVNGSLLKEILCEIQIMINTLMCHGKSPEGTVILEQP